MKLLTLIGIILQLIFTESKAQVNFENNPSTISYSGSDVTRTDVLSNPATIYKTNQYVKLFYTPLNFGFQSFNELGLECNYKFGLSNGVGFKINSVNILTYSETNLSLNGGIEIFPGIGFGIGFGMISKSIQGYSSAISFPINIGTSVDVTKEISFGAKADNINRASISGENLSQNIAIGFGFLLAELTNITFEVNQELDNNLITSLGISHILSKELKFKSGIKSYPATVSGGLDLKIDNFNIDFGSSYSYPIGFKLCFGLGYVFGN